MNAGDDASCGLAQRDPSGEVHAVAQITSREVYGAASGGDPRHGQRCEDHAGSGIVG
jgi:hypothetical protein